MMTDERGPDDLVRIANQVLAQLELNATAFTMPNSYDRAKAVLAALEPHIIEREREAKRDFYTLIVSDLAAKAETTLDAKNKDLFVFALAYFQERFFDRFAATTDTE